MILWGGSPVLPSWKNKEFFKVKKAGKRDFTVPLPLK